MDCLLKKKMYYLVNRKNKKQKQPCKFKENYKIAGIFLWLVIMKKQTNIRDQNLHFWKSLLIIIVSVLPFCQGGQLSAPNFEKGKYKKLSAWDRVSHSGGHGGCPPPSNDFFGNPSHQNRCPLALPPHKNEAPPPI